MIHICITADDTFQSLKPLYINTFLTSPFYISLKGFSPYKERRVFFEKPTQKIFLLSPCIPKFGGDWHVAKPNRPKTRI